LELKIEGQASLVPLFFSQNIQEHLAFPSQRRFFGLEPFPAGPENHIQKESKTNAGPEQLFKEAGIHV
jgi:hypothetical protein